jgi:hypothetical protein
MARRTLIGIGGIALLLATMAGCGALAPPTAWTPGNRQPLILGWQQFFRIQWDGTTRNGRTFVEGYINNTWNFPAQRIQLLIAGYDATGQQLGQLIAWGPNEINPGGRLFFSVPVAPGATTYDVAMFAWNWVQTDGGNVLP